MRSSVVCAVAAAVSALPMRPVHAQVALKATEVASNMVTPLGMVCLPGDVHRAFIVEQIGRIRLLNLDTGTATTFLDLTASGLNLTAASGERGLLGMAFDPDFVHNGRFYVNYTTLGSPFFTRIDRFTATGAPFADQLQALAAVTADPSSRATILEFRQDFVNHNGGALVFGDDGMLYVGSGDGGSGNDPLERAQNLGSLLGKIIRLDVSDESASDGDGVHVPDDNPFRAFGDPADKVWAYGLRNPWRITRDRQTGDLWIGDVGENTQEEINFQPALTPQNFSLLAGRNYGWDCREGNAASVVGDLGCDPLNPPGGVPYTEPVKVYLHSSGACSVTGGFVYRGQAIPVLRGAYFHADYCGNWVKSFRLVGGAVTDERDWTGQLNGILPNSPVQGLAALGEDASGELYLLSISLGRIFRVDPDPASCPCPCDLTGMSDPIIEDNFEADKGWSTSTGPGVTDGAWQRGVPVNDPSWANDPQADADGSGQCFLTANRLGNSDVDGGAVTLTSPVLDFSRGQITICYWYYLNTTGTGDDSLAVEVSSMGAAGPWTRLRTHTAGNGLVWTSVSISPADLAEAGLAMTANTRIRFVATDAAPATVLEAGVDGFNVYTANPFPDCNGNGVDDAADILAQTSADCNNNTIPDECDIAAALAAAQSGGNPGLQIDLDGGPIGNRLRGGEIFLSSCIACHGATGAGGSGSGASAGPPIRNTTRTEVRRRMLLQLPHPGGGFPRSTAQDYADLEYFLLDSGSRGRPDGVIDACQPPGADCDHDGVADARELELGTQLDADFNGRPDDCQCPCDHNTVGGLTVQDIFDYLMDYFSGDLRADFNQTGGITVQDIFDFLDCYFDGCA